MRKLLMGATALGFGLGSLVAAPAASAETLPAYCSVDGHFLNAQADYYTSGSFHVWTEARYYIGGSGTGGESNVNIRILAGPTGDDVVWANDSPDSIRQYDRYTVDLEDTPTRTSDRERVRFRGIFDTSWSDEACTASTVRI
jgi:hypothetical protein